MNGPQSFEKILKFISNDRNSNKNHNDIQFHTHQIGEVIKSGNILVKIRGDDSSHTISRGYANKYK